MQEIISINSILSLPFNLEINDRKFILSKNANNEYILFSNICPHLGADMLIKDDCIECPVNFGNLI